MFDPATLFLGFALHAGSGTPVDRPRFETQFSCNIALVLSGREMMKLSLDPNRFKCSREDSGWVIRGKMRGEP